MFSVGTPATLFRARLSHRPSPQRARTGLKRAQPVHGAWFLGHHLLSGLILPPVLERGVAELAIGGPGSELDLGDELRLNPLGTPDLSCGLIAARIEALTRAARP